MKTASTFKQADYERAVRSARAVNLPIVQSMVDKEGTIILVHDKSATVQPQSSVQADAPKQ